MFNLSCGSYEVQGVRWTMEDKHVYHIKDSGDKRMIYAGVYDGHGGSDVAIYLESELHKRICEDLDLNDVANSLGRIFHQIDEEIRVKDIKAGSTAVIVIIIDNKLYCANVGDSEACLVKEIDNKLYTENLVYVHKARDANESKRILALGGQILFGRVSGSIIVTRAFGDFQFKKPKVKEDFLSVDPYVSELTLDATCKYIILACDGLWDVFNHLEAAVFVDKCIKGDNSLDKTAKELVLAALGLESKDNITVQIIKLDWLEQSKSINSEMINSKDPSTKVNFEHPEESISSNLMNFVQQVTLNSLMSLDCQRMNSEQFEVESSSQHSKSNNGQSKVENVDEEQSKVENIN
jgi:serine/threonine protein phosphatase PrpC